MGEPASGGGKRVLSIGIIPELVDFSQFPDLNAAKVRAGLEAEGRKLADLGYDVDFCLIDLGETAERVVAETLAAKPVDCVMIGAGLRNSPTLFLLFEKVINIVHRAAPGARICFNTHPGDTAAAVARWLP